MIFRISGCAAAFAVDQGVVEKEKRFLSAVVLHLRGVRSCDQGSLEVGVKPPAPPGSPKRPHPDASLNLHSPFSLDAIPMNAIQRENLPGLSSGKTLEERARVTTFSYINQLLLRGATARHTGAKPIPEHRSTNPNGKLHQKPHIPERVDVLVFFQVPQSAFCFYRSARSQTAEAAFFSLIIYPRYYGERSQL